MRRIKIKKEANFFIKAMVFTFIVFCAVTLLSQQLEFNQLYESKLTISRQISDAKEQIDELNDELAQPFDDRYIEKIARSKLKYHMPDEIIFFNDLIR